MAFTRSELYREDDAINFRWSAGDKLGVFPDEGDQVSFAIDDSQAGSIKATFDGGGWALKPSHSYSVYFPYIRDIDLTKDSIPLDYTGQKQTGNNTYTHLGKYDFLASDAVTPTEGNLNFTMNHIGSIMILSLTIEEPGTFDLVKLISENEIFTTRATLNIEGETPVLTSSEKNKEISIELSDVTTTKADEVVTVSMMMSPVDLTSEVIKVYIRRSDAKVFYGKIEKTKNLEAGKPYEMTVLY